MNQDESKHFMGKVAQKAIIEYNGKFLVCRGVGDTLWEFPGGRIHADETPIDSLSREIKEELGITLTFAYPFYVGRAYHVKSGTWQINITYHVALPGNEFILDRDELEEAKWMTKEELKTLPLFDDCRAAADVFLRSDFESSERIPRMNQKSEEYIENDLKRGVDYIGVTCAFWCHDGKGRVLMGKRSSNCRDEQGTWDCGGGAMEFGETFEDTVQREVKEEYGVEPLAIEYMETGNVIREHNGRRTHWVKNVHWVLVDPVRVSNGDPGKIDQIEWFSLDALPSPLHSQIPHEVEMIKRFLAKAKNQHTSS